MDYPNGWSEYYSYDALGRILSVEDTHPSEKPAKTQKHVYEYDANGNLVYEYMRGNGNAKKTASVIKQFVVDFTDEAYRPLTEHEVNGLDYRYVYSDKARLSVSVQGIENGSANYLSITLESSMKDKQNIYRINIAYITVLLFILHNFIPCAAHDSGSRGIQLSKDGSTLISLDISYEDYSVIIPESVNTIANGAISVDFGHEDYHPIDILIQGDLVEIEDNGISGTFHTLVFSGDVKSIGRLDDDTYISHCEFHQYPCELSVDLLQNNIGDITCLCGDNICIFDTSLCGKSHIKDDYEAFVSLVKQGDYESANKILPNRSADDVICEMIVSENENGSSIEKLILEPCYDIVKLESGPISVKPYGVVGYSMTNDGEIVLPDTLKYVDKDGFQFSFRTVVFPEEIEEIKAQPNAQISRLCFNKFPPELFDLESIGSFEMVYLLYESRSDLRFCRIGDNWKNDWDDFLSFVKQGKYDEALAIQNLDGSHPSESEPDPKNEEPSPQEPASEISKGSSGDVPKKEDPAPQTPSEQKTDPPSDQPAESGNEPPEPAEAPEEPGNTEPTEEPGELSEPSRNRPALIGGLCLAAAGLIMILKRSCKKKNRK